MLEINNLSFEYSLKNELFSDVNLSLSAGGICGLLGKNGSGKTTLLKIVAGLIFPNTGSCQILGANSKERCPDFLQEIYFLPEDFFLPAVTSKQYANLYASFYPRFNYSLFESLLKEFEININKILTDLSYGQKKKFLIAFGLATECKLFILDEPTNGLDIPSKAQFRKAIASAVSEERLFIISTHQVHDVENLVDSIVVLDDGEIIFNQSMLNIAQKLAFVNTNSDVGPINSLYSEKYLGGYKSVVINEHDQDTQIDLEILFNAILANKTNIQKIFSEVK